MLGGFAAGSLVLVLLGQTAFGNVIHDFEANPPVVAAMQPQNTTHSPTRAPESGTMALFGIGLIGIGTIGRKWKRGKRDEINL